jgi:DNA-binding response OmpR family regulator
MASLDPVALGAAKVVVFDPHRANLQTTRAVLAGLGLRRVDGYVELKEFKRRLQSPETDMVLFEAQSETFDGPGFLRSVRMGDVGMNPFVPLVGTSWSGSSELIADLINAGADDVLLRPFSTAVLAERIQHLVTRRKPFVVTSDYVGPDRGGVAEGRELAETFTPPNPLRARLVPEEALAPMEATARIEEAKSRARRERAAKLARRAAMAAEVTFQAKGASAESVFVADLVTTVEQLVALVLADGDDEVQDMAHLLERVALRASAPGPEQQENAKLARELALGLYLAYATTDRDAVQGALEDTLQAVRVRLDKARERRLRRNSILAA